MPGRRFFCRRGAEAAEETGGAENEGRAEEAAATAKSAGEPRRAGGRARGDGRGSIALAWRPGRRFSGRRSAGDTAQVGRRGRTSVDIENWGVLDGGEAGETAPRQEKSPCGDIACAGCRASKN